jgi:serine/threonine protein kinase
VSEMADRWPIEQVLADLQAYYEADFELRSCWSEESAGLRAAVEAFRERLSERYAYKRVLGAGGSGVVLRLQDDVFPLQDVALKFPRPVTGRTQLLAEMLGKEINFLAELRHPGIVRIQFHGQLSVPSQPPLPFYLMEAIDGVRSDKFVLNLLPTSEKSRKQFDPAVFETTILEMFRAVLDSIRYLHEHHAGAKVHLDIKPENILVNKSGQPVMIDLGTCKQVNSGVDKTIVACTLPMAPPSLARRLAKDPTDKNRAKGEIDRDQILQTWDLYTFAASMLHWLGIGHTNGESLSDAIPAEALSAYTRKYLLLLAARFMANEKIDDIPAWFEKRLGLSLVVIRSMAVSTARDGLELVDRILSRSSPIDVIPEMAMRAVTTLQPSEGVHVPLTPRLIHLLEHRALRRLDSIAQLGMVVEVYPEARHTRKEHSLGTYAWTIQYVKALYSDPVSPLFKQWVTADDCRDVLLAALLHDIGHFPLAHDLEDIDSDLFDHGDLTNAWLKGGYRRSSAEKFQMDKLDDVLAEWGTTAERIQDLLSAKATSLSQKISPKAKLLRSLISGPIDADKIDYLSRDSDRMHLPYPRGIDVDRILRSLTTIVLDRVAGGARDVPLIGVHAKGKVAAEFVSIARYAMFSQGYWHHTVRAMKAMLGRGVRALVAEQSDAAREILQEKFLEFAFALPESIFASGSSQKPLFTVTPAAASAVSSQGGSEVPQLAATDVAVLRWLEKELSRSVRPEAVLLGGILNRRLFKRLWVVSHDMQPTRWDKIVKLWSELSREKKHRLSHQFETKVVTKVAGATTKITGFSPEGLKASLEQSTTARSPWLLIDIPESRPGAEVGLRYVLEGQRRQLRKDEKVAGQTQESEVWNRYAGSLLQAAGKIRIFCDPGLVDAIEAAVPWENGIETLIETLEDAK